MVNRQKIILIAIINSMVKTLQICPTMPLKVGIQYLTSAVKILMLESSVYNLLNVEDLQTSVKANQLLVQSTAEQFHKFSYCNPTSISFYVS